MDIKRKYIILNRIAVIVPALIGLIVVLKSRQLVVFSVTAGIIGALILVLDSRKYKEINRMFGVFKVQGNSWLGMDGFWHDGYSEIMDSKLEAYYAQGGEGFGYECGRLMSVWFLLCTCGLSPICTIVLTKGEFAVVMISWLYVIARKTIWG